MIHIVRQGDSIISLSKRYGIPVDKILNHPENSSLRERKRNASILSPWDRITIPDKELREEEGATEQRHRFRCNNRTSWLRVKFLRKSEPRAGEPYCLIVDGKDFRGSLDNQGKLENRVPSDAKEAVVLLGREGEQERHVLKIGHINPSSEISGVQQRLKNLGFSCGSEDNEVGPRTRSALRRFQEKQGLQVTGEMDEATQNRLREIHGS